MEYKKLLRDAGMMIVVAGLMVFCFGHQKWYYHDWWQGSGKYIQRVRLPNDEMIKIAALGYDQVYADFLTLRAIQMFGASWGTEDNSTDPIYDYFDILTDLDPHFVDVYRLANLVLSDLHGKENNGQGHKQGVEILMKGMRRNPSNYDLPYLGIYTALWGLNDTDKAKVFLRQLQRIPDTPPHMLRMEEYIERQSGRYYSAFDVNLKQYLTYVDEGMEAEQGLAYNKFTTIISGWYRLELSRAIDQYVQDTGEHPRQIEDLMTNGRKIEFKAASFELLNKKLDEIEQIPNVRFQDYQDDIREAAMEDFVGLPPEPSGSWYFISSLRRRDFLENPPANEARRIEDRYPYLTDAISEIKEVDRQAVEVQKALLRLQKINDTAPTKREMAGHQTADWLGGHFVYFQAVTDEYGYTFPRYFSTETIRINQNKEPRFGLRGTPDQWPRRQYFASSIMPPYLTAEPSIWDHPDDAKWAFCRGMSPPMSVADFPKEKMQVFESSATYKDCDEHVELPTE